MEIGDLNFYVNYTQCLEIVKISGQEILAVEDGERMIIEEIYEEAVKGPQNQLGLPFQKGFNGSFANVFIITRQGLTNEMG